MLEKLVALDLPAGLVNNGTTYQTKGRWNTANLVRFYQGTKQPVGGWVARTVTGATITGTPNAAVSWQTNAGQSYLAIGTTSNLYVVDSSNVVYDITPTTIASDGLTHVWQLDVFGTYLLATFERDSYIDSSVINAFVWTGSTSTPAAAAYTTSTGPGSVYGVCVAAERFMVLLRGADPIAFTPDTGSGGGGGTGTDTTPAAPTATPPTPTLAASATGTHATASWTNTDSTASVRIEWSTSATQFGTYAVADTVELTPESTSRGVVSTSDQWFKARLQYFNAGGASAWGSLSTAVEVTGLS